jgi:hypothetical protein
MCLSNQQSTCSCTENWFCDTTTCRPSMQLTRLGGDCSTMITDLDQIGRMRFLRIKIDVVTQGFREVEMEYR